MTIKYLTFSLLFILLCASVTSAQNVCGTPAPTAPVANPKFLNVILPDQNTIGADNTPITTDYTIEAILNGNVAASVTIPKGAFNAVSGTPANCFSLAFPMFTVSQTNVYGLRMKANGPFGTSMFGVSSNGFFIQAAPRAPESLRLTVFNMLQKAWLQVYSTLGSGISFRTTGK